MVLSMHPVKIIYIIICAIYAMNILAHKGANGGGKANKLAPTQIMPTTQSAVNDAVQVENQVSSGSEGGHGR